MLTAASDWSWAPIVAASIAALVAVAGLVLNGALNRVARRRELHAEAYKSGLAMVEMVYRVNRADASESSGIADRYHQLHEDINFHQGWIEVESVHMGRAYRRFILSIRAHRARPRSSVAEPLRALRGERTFMAGGASPARTS